MKKPTIRLPQASSLFLFHLKFQMVCLQVLHFQTKNTQALVRSLTFCAPNFSQQNKKTLNNRLRKTQLRLPLKHYRNSEGSSAFLFRIQTLHRWLLNRTSRFFRQVLVSKRLSVNFKSSLRSKSSLSVKILTFKLMLTTPNVMYL